MAHVRTYQLGQYTGLYQKILNELAAAKACLLDPQKKAVYDRHLRTTAGTAEALKKPVDSRPVSGPTRPAPAKPTARSLPRWFGASLAGGIALLLAGVGAAVVLTRNRGGNEVVRAPDSAKPVDTARAGRTASKLAGSAQVTGTGGGEFACGNSARCPSGGAALGEAAKAGRSAAADATPAANMDGRRSEIAVRPAVQPSRQDGEKTAENEKGDKGATGRSLQHARVSQSQRPSMVAHRSTVPFACRRDGDDA